MYQQPQFLSLNLGVRRNLAGRVHGRCCIMCNKVHNFANQYGHYFVCRGNKAGVTVKGSEMVGSGISSSEISN